MDEVATVVSELSTAAIATASVCVNARPITARGVSDAERVATGTVLGSEPKGGTKEARASVVQVP